MTGSPVKSSGGRITAHRALPNTVLLATVSERGVDLDTLGAPSDGGLSTVVHHNSSAVAMQPLAVRCSRFTAAAVTHDPVVL